MKKNEITIGFKYSVFRKGAMTFENYWESFEVVGILYGNGYQGGRTEWKTKENILNSLEKQVQVISLTDKYQQNIFIISIEKLVERFQKANKLLPEFRGIRID